MKRKSIQPLNETLEKMSSTLEFILQELRDIKENVIFDEENEFYKSLTKSFLKLNREKENKTSI